MSRKPTDLPLGTKFGDWTVIGEAVLKEKGRIREYYIPVRCVCGTEKLARKGNLTGGESKGCGCEGRKRTNAANSAHYAKLREQKAAERKAQIAARLKAKGFAIG